MILRLLRGDVNFGPTVSGTDIITLKLGTGQGTLGTYDSVIAGCSYLPEVPQQQVQRTSQVGQDGETITNITFRNATESCEVIIDDALGGSDAVNLYNLILEFFKQAERYQETGLGDQIYLEWTIGGTTENDDYYRAEILRGEFDYSDTQRTRFARDGKGIFNLIWERKPVFELRNEVQANLSNPGTPATSSWFELGNRHDSSQYNWVEIQTPTVTEMPARSRIEIRNNSGKTLSKFYMGYNDHTTTDFDYTIEAEDSDSIAGQSTFSATAHSASGEVVLRRTFTVNDAFDAFIFGKWTITGTQLEYAGGNRFRVIGFFHTPPDDDNYECRVRMETTDLIQIVSTRWISLDSRFFIQEFGTVQLPPKLANMSLLNDLKLYVDVRHSDTGSHTLDLDYLQLMPLNNWRKLIAPQPEDQAGVPTTDRIIDDGFLDTIYLATPGNYYPLHRGDGPQLRVTQDSQAADRLVFLTESATVNHSTTVDQTISLKLFYKPAYLLPP